MILLVANITIRVNLIFIYYYNNLKKKKNQNDHSINDHFLKNS